jgi:septum formation protein
VSAPLVLASASPRRSALLAAAGFAFTADAAELDEDALFADVRSPARRAMLLARAKAEAVARRHAGALVLGADTMVVLDDEILGKPEDEAEAIRMLSRLSGRSHEVVTGLALVRPSGAVATAFASTAVSFARWPAGALLAYVRAGEPLDKAGAYGIQGGAGAYVERVDGCFFNVVGLPLERVRALLRGEDGGEAL